MHFPAVVSQIKSNSNPVSNKKISKNKYRKERSYGSILHIIAMLPPTLVNVF